MQRSGSTEAHLQGWVLRMRGLPYTATAADVLAFFEGLEIARGPAGVVFTCTADGRPLGEAYVEFSSEDAQQVTCVVIRAVHRPAGDLRRHPCSASPSTMPVRLLVGAAGAQRKTPPTATLSPLAGFELASP